MNLQEIDVNARRLGDDNPRKRLPSADSILKLTQTAAILVAAVWTLYLFGRFNESLSRIKLQREQIGVERELQDLTVARSKRATWNEHVTITNLGDPHEDGTRLCCVSLGYSITNIGQTRTEVTYVLVRAYRARLPRLDPNSAVRVNTVCEKGDLDWMPLLCRGCYYAPKWKEGMKHQFKEQMHAFQKGGGGTAELDAGDSSSGDLAVLIRAGPEDLIGFHAIIGFDGGKTDDDRWEITEWAHFQENDRDMPPDKGETQ